MRLRMINLECSVKGTAIQIKQKRLFLSSTTTKQQLELLNIKLHFSSTSSQNETVYSIGLSHL